MSCAGIFKINSGEGANSLPKIEGAEL